MHKKQQFGCVASAERHQVSFSRKVCTFKNSGRMSDSKKYRTQEKINEERHILRHCI